jgi:hypothetical protein
MALSASDKILEFIPNLRRGMTLLEVIKAYPEQVEKLIRAESLDTPSDKKVELFNYF